ncbi:LEM-3-like GIY-YIG domain-containing protein [Camelimonas lactis]|uniref:GIY-YIG domain-containing protein n=1 Tax=Camelimonas lactis TaxID=659006 RepID=A0A4R2GLZ9_9HYPH|nr:hypothetical protein [Camelimonas lactis]TCO10185.1 hypothetical protein EV666_11558 [Camelimonas lactis]
MHPGVTEMKKQPRFSEEVCARLGNYVYRLIDPRNGETFYIGKGRNNRVFDHAAGVTAVNTADLVPDDDLPDSGGPKPQPKLERIRAILNAGLEVVHVIHRHELDNKSVFEVEAALIDAFPGLTNIAGGHGSGDRGPMHYQEIIDKFSLPVLEDEPPHKLVLININKLENRSDSAEIYRLARYCWRIAPARAERADYVLAVVRGVVVGAFRPHAWMSATKENFPEIPYADNTEAHRFGFSGESAAADIWDRYVGPRGKRVVNPALRHSQNPVRYWKC